MAFEGYDAMGEDRPIAQINMIPLIDVMLVLLVIFIITAPLLTHSVKVDLPRASSHPNVARVENVQLAIDAAGTVFWNGQPVDRREFERRLAASAALAPQPELHLRADRATPYQHVAAALAAAARAGLTRVGFVTDPRDN